MVRVTRVPAVSWPESIHAQKDCQATRAAPPTVSLILDIPREPRTDHAVVQKLVRITSRLERHAMRGQVKFYDANTAWGLVLGDDGTLYGVTGARPPDAAALIEGEYILFEPQAAPGGPRAAVIRRLKGPAGPRTHRADGAPSG